MSKVIAVIGAGYGDEGKGLITDYFSAKHTNSVVIRSNGGAQAGHTVTTPEGQRHVFSHFGSGTFNGSATFLSSFFVSNPFLFIKEHKAFVEEFNIKPKIYVDPDSQVTIPYDMLLNQTMEQMRGDSVHGSCGVGFGETLERVLMGYRLTVGDLYEFANESGMDELIPYMHEIRDDYVPTRLDTDKTNKDFKEIINSDGLLETFFDACRYMLENITITTPERFSLNTIVFEGAQGLLLDMDYGYFPHVTRSNCGMKNISKILERIPGEHDITAHYLTRAYTTRHGAGPLAGEVDKLGHNIVDKTNITNEFQGSLRFAPLDTSLFNSITNKDFLNYAPRDAKTRTIITCMDQLGSSVQLIQNQRLEEFHTVNFIESVKTTKGGYLSFGPTRDDVKTND
jgi:adenylosuccinate synthase